MFTTEPEPMAHLALKNIKKALFITVFIVASLVCNAQNRSRLHKDTLIKTIADIGSLVMNNYNPDQDSVKSYCIESCVFIKFRINPEKGFTDIAFNEGTPKFVGNALVKTFERINKKLAISNIKALSKKVFILPFQYSHNAGCGFQNDIWTNANDKESTVLDRKIYAERQLKMRQSDFSIFNMTTFSDGYSSALECVLLSPVSISGSMW